jgi:hypothetical protein
LQPVTALPEGCTEIPPAEGRIVLALGEVTGHAHAIHDHVAKAGQAGRIAEAARRIARAAFNRPRSKARLWSAGNGETYLEVSEPVTLRHEEHSAHTLTPGIYWLPRQMEYIARGTAARESVRRVVD